MSARPRLLETHGCQGCAHAGYVRAGWDVTGVDIDRRHAKYYPGELVIADAATYIREHGHDYDAIHASPPCQWYTRGNAKGRANGNSKWSRSIPEIREAMLSTGKPYVIENVTDAAWDMLNPVALCGCMFDLSTLDTDGIRIHLKRERMFETNWGLTAPRACDHSGIEWWAGSYGGARRDKYEAKYVRRGGYVPRDKAVVKALLGVDHEITWNGLYEGLPPAYTEWVGTQLLEHLRQQVATLTFNIPANLWLTSNRPIRNHAHKSRIVRDLHELGATTARTARLEPIVGAVAVDWTVRYPKGVRRDKGDAANAHPTCKALLDSLVPTWLADDGPQHVTSETYRRGPNLDVAGLHQIRLVLTSQDVPWMEGVA